MSRALCNLILKDLKSLESRYKLKKGPQAHSPRKLRIRCKQQIKSLALRYKLEKRIENSQLLSKNVKLKIVSNNFYKPLFSDIIIMKKSLVIISFAFIFLLSMSIISDGDINQDGKISFGEWLKGIWGKITGKAAGQPSPPIISWTQWFDYDSPGGSGDYELLTSLRTAYPGKICDSPANIECQTTTGLDYTVKGEVVTCDVTKGAICVNAQQPDGTCNYD